MPKAQIDFEEINEKFADLVETDKKPIEVILNLSEDDEVFILQAPTSINMKKMKGGNLEFFGTKSCQISMSSVTHDCILQPVKKAKIHVIDAESYVKQVNVKGVVRLKAEKLKK